MNTSLPRLIDLIKEGSYPSSFSQGIGLAGDGTKQKQDRDKIAHFLWSVPAFDDMSSSQIGAMLDDVYAEWETLKPQYQDNIDKYIDYLDNTGGLQAFLREVNTMKTNKTRLMELANVQSKRALNEAVDPNFPVKLTINIKAGDLLNMFAEAGSTIGSGAVPMDAQEFNRLVATMNEDLNNWFSNEGITWIEDGLNSDVYGEYEDYE